jgi:RNA polymerase sigma-70 factor (ECF subfamily)
MADGDRDAAAAFVRRFQARVYGLALTIVRVPAAAEDVAQDVFLKAWRHAASYDVRRGRVSTWLLTIARNTAVDAVRYGHESPMDPDVLMTVMAPRAENLPPDDLDTSLTLRRALAELPLEQRRPILLMTFKGMTAQEIADDEGVPVGTVKSRVRRGLHRLGATMAVRDG